MPIPNVFSHSWYRKNVFIRDTHWVCKQIQFSYTSPSDSPSAFGTCTIPCFPRPRVRDKRRREAHAPIASKSQLFYFCLRFCLYKGQSNKRGNKNDCRQRAGKRTSQSNVQGTQAQANKESERRRPRMDPVEQEKATQNDATSIVSHCPGTPDAGSAGAV